MFTGRDVELILKAAVNDVANEAALICERMRPHGGRAFDEGQQVAFAALSDAAENIRKQLLRS